MRGARGRPASAQPTLFPLEAEAPARDPAADAPPAPAEGCFVDVALDRPMRREYTYAVPDALADRVAPGMRVAVPFAGRREVGVVVRVADRCDVPAAKLKRVAALLDDAPVVGEGLLALARWIADRWACSWGEALAAALPAPLKREGGRRTVLVAEAAPGVGPEDLAALEEPSPKQHRVLRTLLDAGGPVELRDLLRRANLSDSPARTLARKGLVRIRSVEARPDALSTARADRPRPERLTPDQETAVGRLTAALEAGEARAFLLQGVTGSGKTEVYLRAIERALALGRGAIVLVPEIALTPQTVGWFRARFGEVAVMHSGMTDVQRLDMWRRVRAGEARVVVGARSAVFAPVDRLGVVVVDEEHEPSFKQASTPRYHAREVAVERARRAGAVCVLGSATPALESWWAARRGELELLRLPARIGGARLPHVDLVDTRDVAELHRGSTLFSRLLVTLLEEALDAGEQAILFLNRRGYVPVLWCHGCGAPVRCDACSVSLTYHRRIRRLVCHGCCEERRMPDACPTCTRPGLRPLGAGSERVERELATLLPRARARRMDSDTMRRREDYEETLDAFGRGDVDVLVGTQMIAKGLDFPNVTVVGIVAAEMGVHVPDFRASERTFQLVAQVAGRAGRGARPGRIVVQSRDPSHPAIVHAVRHDHEAFVAGELALRRTDGYPPFTRLVRVVLEDPDEERVEATGAEIAKALQARVAGRATVLGAIPPPMEMLRGRHRRHVLVKVPAEGAEPVLDAVREVMARWAGTSRPGVAVDVDPMSML